MIPCTIFFLCLGGGRRGRYTKTQVSAQTEAGGNEEAPKALADAAPPKGLDVDCAPNGLTVEAEAVPAAGKYHEMPNRRLLIKS